MLCCLNSSQLRDKYCLFVKATLSYVSVFIVDNEILEVKSMKDLYSTVKVMCWLLVTLNWANENILPLHSISKLSSECDNDDSHDNFCIISDSSMTSEAAAE